MPRTFSANLGFLWKDLPLDQAIRAAHRAGFAAVECHWPYEQDQSAILAALEKTGLPMLGLNTALGGGMGLAALAGQVDAARKSIEQALEWAAAMNAPNVHVMAGNVADGANTDVFIQNLRYACDAAKDRVILIEALNRHDAPDYFLNNQAQALDILQQVEHPNLKIMFDCYHVARTEGDVMEWLSHVLPHIGHIQFAGVPDRGDPMDGTLDYRAVFSHLERLGWTAPLGAEYRPAGRTQDSLGWMDHLS